MAIFAVFLYSKLMQQIRLVPITKIGFADLLKKRDKLLLQRPEAVKTLKAARELGDLSENGLYRSARYRLSGIDSQLRKLNMQIKLSDVMEPKTFDFAQIGTTVTVLENGIENTYQIVGDLEADPGQSKTSTRSPIGRAILGKKVGNKFYVNIPKGKVAIEVLEIK